MAETVRLAIAMGIAIGAAFVACASFEESKSTPEIDSGVDGTTSGGLDGTSLDGPPPVDAGSDVFIEPSCKVKDSGCEDGGCLDRCPPNVAALANDVLMAIGSGGPISLRNLTDCNRYACGVSVAGDASFPCSAPPLGKRFWICSQGDTNACGPGGTPFSIGVSDEFDCSKNNCTYSCQIVAE